MTLFQQKWRKSTLNIKLGPGRKSNIRQVRYLLQLLSAVVCEADGRRVVWAVSRWQSHGVSGSFDDRRPSSLRTTIVVPTKIAWCVPSFKYAHLYLNLAGSLPEVLVANFACLPTRCYLDEILVERPFTLFGNVLPCLLMSVFPSILSVN